MPNSIDTSKIELKQCPLCEMQPGLTSKPPGTARHLHCLCTHADLSNTRNLSYDAIEATLRKYKLLRTLAPSHIQAKHDIANQIGNTLKRLDKAPRIDKDGKIEQRRAIITTQTELRHSQKTMPSTDPQSTREVAPRPLPHTTHRGTPPPKR